MPISVRGEYAAFTDPRATDLSILGRDVLDNFDVILSRRRDEVLLLASNHQYLVNRTCRHARPIDRRQRKTSSRLLKHAAASHA